MADENESQTNLARLIQAEAELDNLRIALVDLVTEASAIRNKVKAIILNVQAGLMQDAMENLGIETDTAEEEEPLVDIPPPGAPITQSPAIIHGPVETEMQNPYLDDDDDEDEDVELTPAQIAVLEKMR